MLNNKSMNLIHNQIYNPVLYYILNIISTTGRAAVIEY